MHFNVIQKTYNTTNVTNHRICLLSSLLKIRYKMRFWYEKKGNYKRTKKTRSI